MKQVAITTIMIFIILGCQTTPKTDISLQMNDTLYEPLHHQMFQQECDSLYKKAFTIMTDYMMSGRKDSLKLLEAETWLDSINIEDCPKIRGKVRNAKITIYTLLYRYEEAIQYVHQIPKSSFIRPYTKEMYINAMLAYNYKLTGDTRWSSYYKKAISPMILDLLKSPTDTQALIDLYYLKAIFKGRKSILKELDEKIVTDSLNRDTYEAKRETYNTIRYQLIYA